MGFKGLAVSLAVMVFASLNVATSHAQPQPPDAAYEASLIRVQETGLISDADRTLLLSRPEIAATVVDPTATEAGSSSAPGAKVTASASPAGAAAAAVEYCGAWRHQWIRKRTLLGATAYVFNQRLQWCYNGSSVTRVQERRFWLSETSGVEVYKGIVEDDWNRPPAGEVVSYRQVHMENCVIPKRCANTYPWTEIHAGRNGSSFGSSGV